MALVPTNSTELSTENDMPPGMPTTGPDLSLQLKIWAFVQTLWPFLCDPANSPICAASVHELFCRLLSDPEEDTTKASVRILRTKHQEVLDATMHFVARDRPALLLWALEMKLNDCQCDLTAPVLEIIHENGNAVPSTFKDMIGSIFVVLGDVMENVKVGRILGSHGAAALGQTEAGKWPSSTAAIFPAGPAEAIVSFARLYRLTRSPAILDFIRLALPHCPSLASPALNNPEFVAALKDELERAVDNIETDRTICGTESEYVPGENPSPTRSIRTIAMVLQTLIVTFTESLRLDIQSSALIPSARGIHDLLLAVLIRIKRSPSKTKLSDFCFYVSGIALSLITALPKTHPQRPPTLHPVILEYAKLHNGGTFCSVYSVISRLTESVSQCCSATCAATSESSTQKLQYCGQCQVMRYCSGACQKNAWRYHKLVCKDLEKLKKEALPKVARVSKKGKGFGKFLEAFEKEARKLGFTTERMTELSAELTPFLHFENAGMKKSPSHKTANHL
ncbi:hypothetical protein GGX14DRAFT_479719 [Mycena pura]|uniref:MYND-type domain-containing protein n=1 Tax=Mycena pura TaxID=153505 RepID=A0AAD6UR96_9AGAR|nr:hypothetical protein GGX14DRAFT_479719 [Mycena pura]